ncbi:MAG: hypothetical protein HC919_12630 [Oscillatoriales cyanobacterium SM2_2_1]|nr:hypothetical protein [Oscillatoriales cyanobacterium SM2_2_1]
MGVKPNAAYYGLGISGLLLGLLWGDQVERREKFSLIWVQIIFWLLTLLLGGFWYGRNLWAMGKIFDSSLVASSMELSVLRNLTNPDLYILRPESVTLALAIATVVMTLIFFWHRPQLRLVAGFLAVAIAAFIVTPNGIYRLEFAGGSTSYLQLRYGIIMVPLTGMLWLGMALASLPIPWHGLIADACENPTLLNFAHVGLPQKWVRPMVIAVGLAVIVQLLTYRSPDGLPGFDHILFAPGPKASQIYEWVQSLPSNQPKTLYGVGLRPFGLYGRSWQNRVIDGGSPRTWQLSQLAELRGRSQPVDYLLISLDPFTGSVPPALLEILSRPQEFRPVYADDLAAAFQVLSP